MHLVAAPGAGSHQVQGSGGRRVNIRVWTVEGLQQSWASRWAGGLGQGVKKVYTQGRSGGVSFKHLNVKRGDAVVATQGADESGIVRAIARRQQGLEGRVCMLAIRRTARQCHTPDPRR